MKTFEFPVETSTDDYHWSYFDKIEKTNAFYQMLEKCYSWHIPVQIRPDDVVNTISCIWSRYIVQNAEDLREFFVAHEGKKDIVYKSGGSYSDDRLEEFMSGLIRLVKEDQSNDNLSWMDFSSSTTTNIDNLTRLAAQLSSQKEYYKYGVQLACGFPSVTLLGTDKDWEAVEFFVQSMVCPDEKISEWQKRLLKTITGMISGDEEFWQSCITDRSYGSGPRWKKGWVLDFNPFNENGDWLDRIEEKDILNLTVDFEINVNDNGKEFKVQIESGPNSLQVDEGKVSVKNYFNATSDEKVMSVVV